MTRVCLCLSICLHGHKCWIIFFCFSHLLICSFTSGSVLVSTLCSTLWSGGRVVRFELDVILAIFSLLELRLFDHFQLDPFQATFKHDETQAIFATCTREFFRCLGICVAVGLLLLLLREMDKCNLMTIARKRKLPTFCLSLSLAAGGSR